ncbi:MAG TPA: alginate export family protein [Pseudomonadales bacterium]|nr:alginate export family protein [Pseudomonadales bacterium]
MKMTKINTAVTIGSVVFSASAFAWDPVQDALTTTAKLKLDFRMRYEEVDDESPLKNADATTLRSRLSYESGPYQDFTVGLEMDDVSRLSPGQRYNDGVDGKINYSPIIDPENTEVNQAWINYAGIPKTNARFGRQRITLDNERFIGAAAFRQNEQTYDSFSLSNKSLPDTTIYFANITNVNTVFGPDNDKQGEYDTDTNLFNLKYEGIPGLTLSGYAYLMDYTDDENRAAFIYSNDTYGVRAAGKNSFGDETLKYILEYATQSDAYDNPVNYSADYYLGEISYGNPAISGKIGYEVLGADDNASLNATGVGVKQGFQTPLGSLHKFQGWADQFLGGGSGNIATGIEDQYFGVEGLAYGLNWGVTYHQFDAYNSTAAVDNLGNEWDASVEKKWGNYSVNLSYAAYNADDSENLPLKIYDKDKLWLTLQATF